MDRVDIGDRVRAAALDAGLLPNDPLGLVVDELADIPEEVERRIKPILEEIQAARAAVEQAAKRPTTLTEQQIDELAKRLAQSCAAWSGGLVLAANRKSVGLILATVLGAVLAGGVASWLAFGMPVHPACVEIQGGGEICGAWTGR